MKKSQLHTTLVQQAISKGYKEPDAFKIANGLMNMYTRHISETILLGLSIELFKDLRDLCNIAIAELEIRQAATSEQELQYIPF